MIGPHNLPIRYLFYIVRTFGLKYITLNLTGIRQTNNNNERKESQFYLNLQSFNLIEGNYRYHTTFPIAGEIFKWKPENLIQEFIEFNKIHFKPEHNFYYSTKLDSVKTIIHKEPGFSVKYSGLSEEEIKDHISLLCSLYTFYSEAAIDYSVSKIYTDDKWHIEIRDIENYEIENVHGLFGWNFNQNKRFYIPWQAYPRQ